MNEELIDHMFDKLTNPYKELTEWEEEFVLSVRGQWERKKSLSQRQIDILERIYAEKTD